MAYWHVRNGYADVYEIYESMILEQRVTWQNVIASASSLVACCMDGRICQGIVPGLLVPDAYGHAVSFIVIRCVCV